MEKDIVTYRRALEDFKKARGKAAMQRFWAGISGESLDLLLFDEISAKLHAVNKSSKSLQTVPLDKIVGSVGRTADFDRNFLPLNDSIENRWANVKTMMLSPSSPGLPAVELYKISDAYFVIDGNHRVSVAKQAGFKDIEAYVTELKTKVPIDKYISPETLVRKAAYSDFLEATRLDEIIPGVDFSLNQINHYDLLKEHIAVHRYYMGIEAGQAIEEREATLHWYDTVYAPVVEMIESSGLANVMPDMTMADLYLWVLDQQTKLQGDLAIPVSTGNAIEYSLQQDGRLPQSLKEKLGDEVTSTLDEPPAPDSKPALPDCLFRDILVALSTADENLEAVRQAVYLSQCAQNNIRGLHVLPDGQEPKEQDLALKEKFSAILAQTNLNGTYLEMGGVVSKTVSRESLLSDLLVLKLNYPLPGSRLNRFSHGIPAILREGRRPVMIVKNEALPLTDLLLLYDGSLKSKEGLFIAAYLGATRSARITLLSLDQGQANFETVVSDAKKYLDLFQLPYQYEIAKGGSLAERAASLAKEQHISTLICGGYSGTGLLDRIIGSEVDELLQKVEMPVLICQ